MLSVNTLHHNYFRSSSIVLSLSDFIFVVNPCVLHKVNLPRTLIKGMHRLRKKDVFQTLKGKRFV